MASGPGFCTIDIGLETLVAETNERTCNEMKRKLNIMKPMTYGKILN